MLLIYTFKLTPRVSYIFDHIFKNILQTDYQLTTNQETFKAYEGNKMTYSKESLGEGFFIHSDNLLFDHGVDVLPIEVHQWNELPIFFKSDTSSDLPFDIFAASFFLITRYEEAYPSMRDKYDRYSHKESLAYRNNFLDKPLVDLWLARFKKILSDRFPDMNFKPLVFKQKTVVDIMEFYAFREKGFLRTLGGVLVDIYKLRFSRIWKRFSVLFRIEKDPYDIFDELINTFKTSSVDCLFFVNVGDFGVYDKPISYMKNSYRSSLMSIADYHKVNLLVSFEAFNRPKKMKKERERLENILKRNIDSTRFHFNKLDMPLSYKILSDLEFVNDYTMGYTDIKGFRASTCVPYYYYNPVYEVKLNVKVHPFCIYKPLLLDNADSETPKYKEIVKNLGGCFTVILSNSLLGINQKAKELLLKHLS